MSERLIHKQADLQGLSTAILLPSVDLFGAPVRNALSPLTQVVGIGLFQRTVLTLQRAGIRQLIVLAGSDEEQLKQALGRGPRITIPVRWMPIREFPLDDPRTWEALAAEVRGFCLLSGVAGVFSRSLIEQLRQDIQQGQAIVVAHKTVRHDIAPHPAGFSRLSLATGVVEIADLVVLPAALLGAAGRSANEAGTIPIRPWLEGAAADGRLRVLSTGSNPSHWYQDLRDIGDLRTAERKLFASLKSDFEGIVDRYFNRGLSRRFTRVFLAIGLSPNSVTMLATMVGLAAAAGFGLGTYAAGRASALLFQLAAVIYCSDGEVARLTFTESAFGAWLDIVMDNVVHMAIFGGIAMGAYARAADTPSAWMPLALGAAAIVGNVLSFVLVSKAQRIKAASRWRMPTHAAWSDFMLKNVASRDFTVVVLFFAILGKLDWFLWIAAAGSIVFAAVMLWVVRPSAVTRA